MEPIPFDQLSVGISNIDECVETQAQMSGRIFNNFFRPMVETTLAVGKINPQALDPLIIITPQGMVCVAKTVREKGDGEGAVFFMSKAITSNKPSYICMDFNEDFLKFCRAVRQKDVVAIKFDREFFFVNVTRADELRTTFLCKDERLKIIYEARANSITDIQKEIAFALELYKTTPQKWTGRITIPAREVRKFYNSVWRYQHRALFYHVLNKDNASVIAYSEDALRDVLNNTLTPGLPAFETPKRRFFMARHFVSGEDNITCEGQGTAMFRSNFRILVDVAKAGLDFEIAFSDLKTPYGITVRDDQHCFMMIGEHAISDEVIVQNDLNNTLRHLISLERPPLTKAISHELPPLLPMS